MEDKVWIEIKCSIAGGGVSDEYMINNLEHYGYYDDIEDAISALLDIKNFMGEDDEANAEC